MNCQSSPVITWTVVGVRVGVGVGVRVRVGGWGWGWGLTRVGDGVGVGVRVRVLGLGLGVRGRMVTWKMASIASKKESKLTRGGLSSSKSHMHEGELSAVACSAPAWG